MSAREKPAEPENETSEVFNASLENLTVAGRQTDDSGDGALILDLDGFEGPLDLLLVLARSQKVDLRKISILALADQYLYFILDARKLRLEIAADYLVMAAWLTYMKSRLLLPEPPAVEGEPSGEELAARLAFQLQRLEAMRNVASRLMSRHRLGREVFARGTPEGIRLIKRKLFTTTLYDLLKAYGDERSHQIAETPYQVRKRTIYAIEEARRRLEAMLGRIPNWSRLDDFLPERAPSMGDDRRTYLASALSAALELVKDGHAEIRQEGIFEPVFLRPRIRPVPDVPPRAPDVSQMPPTE